MRRMVEAPTGTQQRTFIVQPVSGQRVPGRMTEGVLRPRFQVVQPGQVVRRMAPEVIDIADEEESTELPATYQQGRQLTESSGIHRIIRRPVVRIPGRGGGYVNVVSRIPVQGAPGIIRRQIPVDRNVRYYTTGSPFRRTDTIKTSESGINDDVDPDFQRIEANLMKVENKCRKELESQRFSGLSSVQSRLTGGVPQEVRLLTQKLLNAKSNLEIEPDDEKDNIEIKNLLNEMVNSVCNKDLEEGWHRDILRKIRSSVVPVMQTGRITGPQVKRSNHRVLEALMAEKCEAIKKHILKRRSIFELSVEYDNQFIKKTRSGAIVCVPYGQTYARIGASWPPEPPVAETVPLEISAREPENSAVCDNIEPVVKSEPISDFSPNIQESKMPLSEFSGSPTRTSGRQPTRLKRLSPGVEESPTKAIIQSICHNGVSIIPPIDMKDIRKSKPGRPSNKDRRKMERQIAIQRKKLTKPGATKAVAIEFDVNACHCVCRQPYDPKKFYLACNGCKRWFHGKCVNLTEKKAKKLPEWLCVECSPGNYQLSKKSKKKNEEYSEEDNINGVFCLCRQPYDPSKDYIGCDSCKDWFHFECVKVTHEQTRQINQYICPICREPEAILEAAKAMQDHEYSKFFSREGLESEEFRSQFPSFDCIEDIVEKVQEGKYSSLREFRDEVSAFYTGICNSVDENHILHKAIKEIINTASEVMLNALPDHPELTDL